MGSPGVTIAFTDRFPAMESRAMRKKLEGMTASASSYPQGRGIPVEYVEPDFELVKASYPGIYIAYGAVTKANDREVRGPTNLQYAPPGLPVDVQVPEDMDNKDSTATVNWPDTGFDRLSSPYYVADHPIPYNLDFQVAVLTRNYQQTFEIIGQLQDIERLPERFGFLEVPEDGTVRTLELLGGPDTSVIRDEDGKRLVQTLYSVRVAAELSLYDVETIKRVETVDVNFIENNTTTYL